MRKAFDGEFAFYHTGVANVGKSDQLSRWVKSLEKYGMKIKPRPKDWFAAFDLLADGLSAMPAGRKVVFIDELPWMDTAKSKFVSALENFWNGWASTRDDIVMQGAVDVAPDFWSTSYMTQSVKIWCGLAFERVCLGHVDEIKKALGVSGVRSQVYAWNFVATGANADEQGAQIDLLIDRADGVVNLCEMKFLAGEYVIDAEESRKLELRRETLIRETGTTKAVHLTVVSVDGVRRNEYFQTVQNVVTGNDLFG